MKKALPNVEPSSTNTKPRRAYRGNSRIRQGVEPTSPIPDEVYRAAAGVSGYFDAEVAMGCKPLPYREQLKELAKIIWRELNGVGP